MTTDKTITLEVTVKGVEPSSANEGGIAFAIERKVRELELDGFEEVIAEAKDD